MRTKTVIAAGALALALSACDVTPGGRCDQVGSKATNKDGVSYTCKMLPKDGMPGEGKRVWIRD